MPGGYDVVELFLWFLVIFSADLCAALIEDVINSKKKRVKRFERRYPSFMFRRLKYFLICLRRR